MTSPLLDLLDSKDNFASLKRQVADATGVVPFVGAGLSIPLNYPGWTSFLNAQARLAGAEEEVAHLIRTGEFAKAADLLLDKRARRAFEDALEEAFKDRPFESTNRLTVGLLPRLFPGPVVTTNFDTVLEKVYQESGRAFHLKVWGPRAEVATKALQQRQHFLLKVHGDVADPHDRVLTSTEYDKAYGALNAPPGPLSNLLTYVWNSRSTLFLGCSLQDDRTMQVLKDAFERSPGMAHYALVEAPGNHQALIARAKFLSARGIRPIFYPAGRHDAIYDLLSMLQGQVSPTTSPIVVRSDIDKTKEGPAGDGLDRVSLVEPVPASSAAGVRIFYDATEATFVDHLARHDTIWIVGLTNEHLASYMQRAKDRRGCGWNEVRIIFQSRQLMTRFGDDHLAEKRDDGIKNIIDFFLNDREGKTKKLDIRHANRPLPFVGQLYDHVHVRVAFILPVRDIRSSSYLNFEPNGRSLPATPVNASEARDQQTKHYLDLKSAFENIRNGSTPILTANVIGRHGDAGTLLFGSLIPQNNWRHYRSLLDDRPAHLVTFIILHDGNRAWLQYRNPNNSNGQPGTYGVIPGKVNDDDFFVEPPPATHRKAIYRMQEAFDALNDRDNRTVREANDARVLATASFSELTGIAGGDAISSETLSRVCRTAAVRYLDEKLALDIEVERLTPIGETPFVVKKQEYSLHIEFFGLRVSSGELDSIPARRPFADLQSVSVDKLRYYSRQHKLTMFLDQNLDIVERYLKDAGVK